MGYNMVVTMKDEEPSSEDPEISARLMDNASEELIERRGYLDQYSKEIIYGQFAKKIRRRIKIRALKNYLGYRFDSVIGAIVSLILRFPLTRNVYLSRMNSKPSPKMEWAARRAVIYHPPLSKTLKTGKALIVYYSISGNTEKVAKAIEKGIRNTGIETTLKKASEAMEEDYYDYDIICLGSPSIHSLPSKPIMNLIQKNFVRYRRTPNNARIPSPQIPGKYALVFVTFSGPHVGIDEAYPVGKYMLQEFKHLGFNIRGEWYVLGEFHGWKEGSTRGFMGDIRGKPTPETISLIEEEASKLTKSLDADTETVQQPKTFGFKI
jgi:multimeric flavodoxin WrbA